MADEKKEERGSAEKQKQPMADETKQGKDKRVETRRRVWIKGGGGIGKHNMKKNI